MSRYQLSRIVKLEQSYSPRHRHQSVIHVPFGADPDELLALAQAECNMYGCNAGFMLIPEVCSPRDWQQLVDNEIRDLE